MEFLHKLKQDDDQPDRSQASTEQEASHGPTAGPERDFFEKLIAGSGKHHAAQEAKEEEKFSLLDKLTRKEEREKKAAELVAREAELKLQLEKVAHEKKENESFFERLKDHLDGEAEEEPKIAKAEAHHEDAEPSFFDKLTGKDERQKKAAELNQKELNLRAELKLVEDEKHENEGLLQRLKDHLDGEESEKAKPELDGHPSFLDKITGKAAEEERRRKEEENKSALAKMKDKINEQMGGGQKAEEKEDFLDKSESSPPSSYPKFTEILTACLSH